jgi:uncharacterized membrane protein (DUF2068 family)
MHDSRTGMFRLIAVFKIIKATVLLVAAIGILKMMHSDAQSLVEHWILRLGLDPGNRYVDLLMSKAGNVTPEKVKELGIGGFIYAALFMTEGIGLWLQKRWAEWFTIIITSSLVPFEVWEIVRHVSVGKIVVLIANLAIVVYLLYQIRHKD